MDIQLHTVGHGTISDVQMVELLKADDIEHLVDIRSFPGSRRNPQYGRERMAEWLPAAGVGYQWLEALGGRRRTVSGSRHVAWRNDSFQAYADYMETPQFLAGVDELLALAQVRSLAVMCSETVWWRCHRRMLADYLVLVRGISVEHLMHDGRNTAHPPADFARVQDGLVVYDLGATPPLDLD